MKPREWFPNDDIEHLRDIAFQDRESSIWKLRRFFDSADGNRRLNMALPYFAHLVEHCPFSDVRKCIGDAVAADNHLVSGLYKMVFSRETHA